MTSTELNKEFRILFEDLSTSGSVGLVNYEISVCYTYAQDQIVRALAAANNLEPIKSLITSADNTTIVSTSKYKTAKEFAKVTDSVHDIDYLIKSNTEGDIPVVKATEEMIDAMLSGAYKYPPKNLAYVVMGGTNLIVFPPFNYSLLSLYTRYVQHPPPIITEVLTGTYTIRGLTAETAPILDESFDTILVRAAVDYAIEVYVGQPEKELADDNRGNQ
jgi:hypothetical protein